MLAPPLERIDTGSNVRGFLVDAIPAAEVLVVGMSAANDVEEDREGEAD